MKTLYQSTILILVLLLTVQYTIAQNHPGIFIKNKDKQEIKTKIASQDWAKESWATLLNEIDPYVDRHINDPEWIVSRLAMYWQDGAHYTQCYIKKQDWDYGEGNAPVPTVRLPGMRRWNDYLNVPLDDRTPYNTTGDMLGISRSSGDVTPVVVPYKETGHMIRQNNMEILQLAKKSAFAYWITEDEKYAKFSSDILWTWLLGTYYMNPPLDPEQSTGGPGGYEPGGIMGYYDYEVIHDDRQEPVAAAYDFVHDYMKTNPHPHAQALNKDVTELAGTVFKRFIEIGLIRGGSKGNWNVNRYRHLMNSILVLESNDYYEDGKGREYYIPYYTEKSSKFHSPLPEIMKVYNPETGLWPESPGYASGMIPTILEMASKLYINGVNTFETNPIMEKAAMANLGWLDARGNLVVFGDMRGGPPSISAFESLLSYYTAEGSHEKAKSMATVISKAISTGQYDRNSVDVMGLCTYVPLPNVNNELPYKRSAYSKFHKHIIMKNGNDEENGMMFTLYGGTHQSHLSKNGLAMQFYGKGWALAPDAAAYESYWSKDFRYHANAFASNTIVPGYTHGDITVNAMDPTVEEGAFYNSTETSANVSFADVSADEKRRLVAMVRTSPTTGYYVDIFRSDQVDNDYIHHNLGNSFVLKDKEGNELKLNKADDLNPGQNSDYDFFKNQRKVAHSNDFLATWSINAVSPALNIDMWMMGQKNRELYFVDAPPTTIRADVTPGQVNKAPQSTPTLIVRQNNNNAKENPFVSVFEAYNQGKKSVAHVSEIHSSENFVSIVVNSKSGGKQIIYNAIDDAAYEPEKGTFFKGIFGITSLLGKEFEYLYLGKGTLLKYGKYKLEAVDGAVSAELRMENGKYFYSSDKPVRIQLPNRKAKVYPAGYNRSLQ